MQALNISTAALRGIQLGLDTTANNIANLDTTGYKRKEASFSDLLYDSFENQPAEDTQRTGAKGLRVGSGMRVSATRTDLSQGTSKTTDVPTDLAIEGNGYFMVRRRFRDGSNELKEQFFLTRDGSFHLSPTGSGNNYLTNANGDVLVDASGVEIQIPKGKSFTVKPNGKVIVDGTEQTEIQLVKTTNPDIDRLKQAGDNELLVNLTDVEQQTDAQLKQGALEMSNVDMVKEMSQLTLAQRAYQLNSRALSINDQMMGIATSIRSR